jgi:hypothetical protein
MAPVVRRPPPGDLTGAAYSPAPAVRTSGRYATAVDSVSDAPGGSFPGRGPEPGSQLQVIPGFLDNTLDKRSLTAAMRRGADYFDNRMN